MDSGDVVVVWACKSFVRFCSVPNSRTQCNRITDIAQLQNVLTDLRMVATDNGGLCGRVRTWPQCNHACVQLQWGRSNTTSRPQVTWRFVPIVRVAGGWGAVLATGTTVRWWAFNYTLNTTSDSTIATLPKLSEDTSAVSLYHSDVITITWKNDTGIFGFAFCPLEDRRVPTDCGRNEHCIRKLPSTCRCCFQRQRCHARAAKYSGKGRVR